MDIFEITVEHARIIEKQIISGITGQSYGKKRNRSMTLQEENRNIAMTSGGEYQKVRARFIA